MREIDPRRLWIGHAGNLRDIPRLHATGIRAVVDLAAEEPCAQLSRDLIYCRFPLVDGAENSRPLLVAAIAATVALIRGGIPTLAACSSGMSRSPCILAVSLALTRGTSPDSTLRELTAGRPSDVSPALWNDALKAHDELCGQEGAGR